MGHHTILQDPRLRAVVWRDLVPLSRAEIAKELLLPVPWLLGSWRLTSGGHYLIALPLSFMFFLTGLRIVHNSFHAALGVPRVATVAVLWTMSGLMLGSMHAVRFNHLRHHKHLLNEEDVEGKSAAMSAWGALGFGPAFPVLLHVAALRLGDERLRAQVRGGLAISGLCVALIFGCSSSPGSGIMSSQWARGSASRRSSRCGPSTITATAPTTSVRTLRNRVKNLLTCNMFLHIEHHLFPRVPTCHLPRLSVRIDEVAPELKKKLVF